MRDFKGLVSSTPLFLASLFNLKRYSENTLHHVFLLETLQRFPISHRAKAKAITGLQDPETIFPTPHARYLSVLVSCGLCSRLASLVFNKLSPQVLCLLLLSPLPRALLAHVCMHVPCSSFRGRNRHSLCPHWADSRVGRWALSSQTNKIRTQSAMSSMVENTCTPTPRENDGAELLNSELRTKERPYKERSFKLGVVCK